MTALVTPAEARTYLGVGAAAMPSDPQLLQLIDGLSARIAQEVGITYVGDPEDKASSKMFSYQLGDRFCMIAPCRTITKVEASATPGEPTAGWITLDNVNGWVAEPLGGPVYNRIRFLLDTELPAQGLGWDALALHVYAPGSDREGSTWPSQDRAALNAYAAIRVTAKWGYGVDATAVPANVKLALLMWLKQIHTRDQAFFSEDGARPTREAGMPDDVKAMLEGAAAEGSAATIEAV